MAIDLQHLWAVGEVFTAGNANTYIGPPSPLVHINVFPTAIAQINWDTITQRASTTYAATKDSNAAQNDEINWDIVLGAGTWTFALMYRTGPANGVFTVQLSSDASTFTTVNAAPYNGSVGLIDSYAASGASDVRSTITGITIATAGIYRLKLLMAGKDGSASNYTGMIQGASFKRTA